MRRYPLWILLILSVLAADASAQAQTIPADPIRAGYQLLYNGDRLGASAHFEALLKSTPDDLPAGFGLLTVLSDRLDRGDTAVQPDFERRLDRFIQVAGNRYDGNLQYAVAHFYLVQAHLLRADYCFELNQSMFRAARDRPPATDLLDAY